MYRLVYRIVALVSRYVSYRGPCIKICIVSWPLYQDMYLIVGKCIVVALLTTNLFFPCRFHVSVIKSLNNSVVQLPGEAISSENEETLK